MGAKVVFNIPGEMPEGKVISSISGGQRSLAISLDKLKKFEFTGYLLTRKAHKDFVSLGYLVVRDGVLVAAIYGRQHQGRFIPTKLGEEGLKLAWADSYDTDCKLEVHGRLDIGQIIDGYPDSKVLQGQQQKKVVKRRTRFSLAWGNGEGAATADEAVGAVSEGPEPGMPGDLKGKLDEWRAGGYVVKQLEEALKGDPEMARVLFRQFEENLERIGFLRKELENLDARKFRTDIERIRAMLKNPAKIIAIEAAFQGLKVKMERERVREMEARAAEMGRAPPPGPGDGEAEKTAEEGLAGQGEILPPESPPDDVCTICGASLRGKKICPACGADMTMEKERPKPEGEENLIHDFTFDNFVVGECNRFSQAAAIAVARSQSTTYNPLLISSGAGLGKTHLLNAIGNYVMEHAEGKKVLYIPAERFISEFIEATKKNRKRQFRKRFQELDYLLLDDIHFIAGQEAVQDEFFHIFNTLYKDGKQIVMTCDRPIREVQGIKERLVSRFDAGLITDIQPPDIETRLAILKVKMESRHMVIGDDVLNFIARRYTTNIRKLEGALTTLNAYSDLMKVPPTLDAARQALKDMPVDASERPEAKAVEESVMPLSRKTEKLKVSHSYLIEEEKPVKCFEFFVDSLNMGLKGMALTRMNPKRVRETYDMGDAAVLWLTDREGAGDRIAPVLERIIYKIEDFLNSPGKSILLIDGLDYLISNNSFDAVLRFLRRLIDEVSESETVLITSLTPETIDEQGLKILEREMEIITSLGS